MPFKTIPAYPKYKINEHGVMLNLDGSIRKVPPLKSGHYMTVLKDANGDYRGVYIHRTVAELFLPPSGDPAKYMVAHDDGDPSNNHVDNLYWATARENNMDRNRHGTMPKGITHWRAILTENDVITIRAIVDAKAMTQKDLAEIYKVDRSTIHDVARRKSWKHIP